MEGGVNAFMSGSSARVLWLLPFTVIHLGVYESTYGGREGGREGSIICHTECVRGLSGRYKLGLIFLCFFSRSLYLRCRIATQCLSAFWRISNRPMPSSEPLEIGRNWTETFDGRGKGSIEGQVEEVEEEEEEEERTGRPRQRRL